MKSTALLCCMILFCMYAHAATDTLTAKEKEDLRQALMQTPLGANFQSTRYHKLGDSTKAGEFLIKSDPHYMMFLGQSPETLPEFLSQFKSTKADKDKFIEAFTAAYNAPKNTEYNTFKSMYKEDKTLRNKQGNCNTKGLCLQLDKQVTKTDSVHAVYLYNYVKKNGWPTLENGSLYAGLLAVHDHKNHGFYLPYMKQAVQQGQSTMDALEIVNYYNSTDTRQGEALQKYIDTSKKYSFDVSSLLSFKLPTSISDIKKVFDEHCPVEYHLVFYAPKFEMQEAWFASSMAQRTNDPDNNVMNRFFSQIRKNCLEGRKPEMLENVWYVQYMRSETPRSKMMLYLLYK